MEFMTEVHWHYDDEGIFTHCSISHIGVLFQEGNMITVLDTDGVRFERVVGDYFESDEEAMAHIKQCLQSRINYNLESLSRVKKNIKRMEEFLSKL